MELRLLRYLMFVADEQSFTRAAERLFIAQPSLSKQIKLLEQEVGEPLFDRSGRRTRMTAAGALLYQHAERIFKELDAAKSAIDELAGLRRGSLSVGVLQTVNASLTPRIVATYSTAYPAITLRIEERSADEIEQGVLTDQYQLGIGFAPPTFDHLDAEALFEEEMVLIVSHQHPLAIEGKRRVGVWELEGMPMVLLPQTYCTRRLWDSCARQAGIQPLVSVELNTISSILAAVGQSRNATVLPRLSLNDASPPHLVAIALDEPTPRRTVGLLQRSGSHPSAAARAFVDVLRQVIVSHSHEGSQWVE
jgi:LysR family cyn operon transcriptional activator